MSKTATQQGPSGLFATSRRGGLTPAEIRLVEDLRSGDRPVSWQNIARRLGRCEADVRVLFTETEAGLSVVEKVPEEREPRTNFPWDDAQTGYLIARYNLDGPEAVALVLGCSRTAAIGKAYRLGISQARGWNRAA